MCSALTISFLNSIAVDKLLRDALCGVPFLLRVYLFSKHINEYRKRKVNIELLTVLEHHCEGNRLALLFYYSSNLSADI